MIRRILFGHAAVVIIDLGLRLRAASSGLPPRRVPSRHDPHRVATIRVLVYRALHPPGFTPPPVARRVRELLPRDFTLTTPTTRWVWRFVSVALSVAVSLPSRRLAVSQRGALWCPDVPPVFSNER